MTAVHQQLSPLEQIAALFRMAGFQVTQAVSSQPGVVDWFAVPDSRSSDSTICFLVVERSDTIVLPLVNRLEAARRARGAGRAFLVFMDSLPKGTSPPMLTGSAVQFITYRHLVLMLAGLLEQVQADVAAYQASGRPEHYLPRRALTRTGEEVSVEPYILDWMARNDHQGLALEGDHFSGKNGTINHLKYLTGLRLLQDPDSASVLVDRYRGLPPLHRLAIEIGAAAPAHGGGELSYVLSQFEGAPIRFLERATCEDEPEHTPLRATDVLRLLPPTPQEYQRFYLDRLPHEPLRRALLQAWEQSPDLRLLTHDLANLSPMLAALRSFGAEETSGADFLARLIISYARQLFNGRNLVQIQIPLEDRALRQSDVWLDGFARQRLVQQDDRTEVYPNPGAVASWLALPPGSVWWDLRLSELRGSHFKNQLMLHYFLAQALTRVFQTGYTRPLGKPLPAFVQRLLSHLAIDVVARVSIDSSVTVQLEVERRLRLTIAHLLGRSVGAIRLHLKRIREAIGKEKSAALRTSFERIEEEVAFQADLAQQTRLLSEGPNGEVEDTPLKPTLAEVLETLRERYPEVRLELTEGPEIFIRAITTGLRDLLYCLLENAFHAALTSPAGQRWVSVRTYTLEQTVRVEVRDSGPGVHKNDRERIFDPYVTTKKGENGLLGTGLGLAIARKFSTAMGAQLRLEEDGECVLFSIEFITGSQVP